MMFPYERCVEWLKANLSPVETNNRQVRTEQHIGDNASFLISISDSSFEGELVVWNTGATSLTVFNVPEQRFELDKHDLTLSDHFESELEPFFRVFR